jgi:hypothetical protein
MNSEKIYKDGQYFENNQSWHIEDSPWSNIKNIVSKQFNAKHYLRSWLWSKGNPIQLSKKLNKLNFLDMKFLHRLLS